MQECIVHVASLYSRHPHPLPPPLPSTHTHTHTHMMQSKPDYEFSELILYEVQLMLESGRKEEVDVHVDMCMGEGCKSV